MDVIMMDDDDATDHTEYKTIQIIKNMNDHKQTESHYIYIITVCHWHYDL